MTTCERLGEEIDALKAEIATHESTRAELGQQLEGVNAQLVAVQDEYASAQEAVEKTRTELANAKEEVAAGSQQVTVLTKEKGDLEAKLAHLESVASSSGVPVDEVLVALRKEMDEVKTRLKRKVDQVQVQQHEITKLKSNDAVRSFRHLCVPEHSQRLTFFLLMLVPDV